MKNVALALIYDMLEAVEKFLSKILAGRVWTGVAYQGALFERQNLFRLKM